MVYSKPYLTRRGRDEATSFSLGISGYSYRLNVCCIHTDISGEVVMNKDRLLEELKDICDKAVEGLCPEGHFGLEKCPFPSDVNDMCGQCYRDLIFTRISSVVAGEIINWMDEPCPHTGGLEEQQMYKSSCPKCWQELKSRYVK